MARDVSGGIHFHNGPAPAAAPTPVRKVPRELPGTLRVFVDRSAPFAQLDELTAPVPDARYCALVVVTGTAGVGKTALARQWANHASSRYPDGQLYLNLRGYDPAAPLTAQEALDQALRSLGVEASAIPPEPEARAALYRSMLADRRILIVLDNAARADQVRPLLPGAPECTVLVTSRSNLTGLGAQDGARRVELQVLPEDDAVTLLREVVVGYRDQDDPEELAELARRCARLPLALRVAAERAAVQRYTPLPELSAELRDESTLWDALTSDDESDSGAVRSVFAWSYRGLPPDAAQLFRRLGLHPGVEFSSAAAAVLISAPQAQARRRLDVLVGAHLIEQTAADRYQFHDLLRAYAADEARQNETEAEQHEALRRLLDWYLDGVWAASRVLGTNSLERDLHGARVGMGAGAESAVPSQSFVDAAQAAQWCETERSNLVDAVRAAGSAGFDELAWRLAAESMGIFEVSNPFESWFTVTAIGLDAARRLADRYAEALMLESLGKACRQSHRLDEAVAHQSAALAIRREIGDAAGELRSLNALGLAHRRAGRLSEAEDCFEQVRTLAMDETDQRMLPFALMNLGEVYCTTDRFEDAIALLREAARLLHDSGQSLYEGNALQDLSVALRNLGRTGEATVCAERAVTISVELDNKVFLAEALRELAAVHRAMRHPELALPLLAEALQIQQRLGDRSREALVFTDTAATYRDMDQPERAAEFEYAAAAILRETR